MRSPAAPPYAASSSPSRPGSPGRNAARCCTYPRTGHGPGNGPRYGPTRPDHPPQPEPCTRRPRPTVEKLGRPAGPTFPQPKHSRIKITKLKERSSDQLVHGSRLICKAVCQVGTPNWVLSIGDQDPV